MVNTDVIIIYYELQIQSNNIIICNTEWYSGPRWYRIGTGNLSGWCKIYDMSEEAHLQCNECKLQGPDKAIIEIKIKHIYS